MVKWLLSRSLFGNVFARNICCLRELCLQCCDNISISAINARQQAVKQEVFDMNLSLYKRSAGKFIDGSQYYTM